MRCPICSSPLAETAKTCPQCGCGVLPPPPTGTEPRSFVSKVASPRWPLILSVIGVIAAIAVIAVALLPLLDDDNDEVSTTPAASTLPVGSDSAAPPVSSTEAPVATSSPATTVATSVAPRSTAAPTSTEAPTSSAATTVKPAPTTTSASTSTSPPPTSTSGPTTSTTTSGVFPARVTPKQAQATCTAPDSTDSQGNRIVFNPVLTIDGAPETAWRCEGPSINQALLYTLETPIDLTIVGAIPGYAGSDPFNGTDRFDQNRRVERGRWACLSADGQQVASIEQSFANDRQTQYLTVAGFHACAQVLFEILESSASGGRDYTAVSEIELYGPE